MSAVDILRQARAQIADRSRWTQGVFARAADGQQVYTLDPDAVCWCGVGALHLVTRDFQNSSAIYAHDILSDISFDMFGNDVPHVNDGDAELSGEHPHAAVLRIYDAAIAKAEGRS